MVEPGLEAAREAFELALTVAAFEYERRYKKRGTAKPLTRHAFAEGARWWLNQAAVRAEGEQAHVESDLSGVPHGATRNTAVIAGAVVDTQVGEQALPALPAAEGRLFRKKPVVVEAITFDELVEYGRSHGANVVNGMPWSFDYKGQAITHENDDCYLIPTLEGTMRFDRGDMLITGVKGEIYPCKPDIFAATYEPAPALPAPTEGLWVAELVRAVESALLTQREDAGTRRVRAVLAGQPPALPVEGLEGAAQ